MFKINYFTNSFISVEATSSILTCDPWVGKTRDNDWVLYRILEQKRIQIWYFH